MWTQFKNKLRTKAVEEKNVTVMLRIPKTWKKELDQTKSEFSITIQDILRKMLQPYFDETDGEETAKRRKDLENK